MVPLKAVVDFKGSFYSGIFHEHLNLLSALLSRPIFQDAQAHLENVNTDLTSLVVSILNNRRKFSSEPLVHCGQKMSNNLIPIYGNHSNHIRISRCKVDPNRLRELFRVSVGVIFPAKDLDTL